MADSREYWSVAGDQGTVKISEDVVASIAALAAAETPGVSTLCSSKVTNVAEMLGKKNLSKGIKVEFHGDQVDVGVWMLAKYEYNILEVAREVQSAVGAAIKSMTGLHTASVSVYVTGVSFDEAVPAVAQQE
ncbi:MAG: Asp23/Gls24 family envelope stress response protein [Butyricicoccaceae bacterium]